MSQASSNPSGLRFTAIKCHDAEVKLFIYSPGRGNNVMVTVGIHFAKNVSAVHGVNESGKAILIRPSVKDAALLDLIAKLPPCFIGMKACSGAHYWVRGGTANPLNSLVDLQRTTKLLSTTDSKYFW